MPQLILEYLPLGNLEDQHNQQSITDQESLTILCQCLDALTSVHEDGIVHRDIKPENILVRSRSPLHIKLSDFGLSKATADLQTFCGTHLYAAPEIYVKHRTTYYTKACDIWSLGVVVFKYGFGPLPDIKKTGTGLPWCREIIKRAEDWDSDVLLNLLLTAMLAIDPRKRLPARKCWEQALQLSVPSQSRCATPTQTSYSKSDCLRGASTLYQATRGVTPTEAATFVMIRASRNHNPSMQENKMESTQMTIDNYLIGNDIGEQEVKSQGSLENSSSEVRNHLTSTQIWTSVQSINCEIWSYQSMIGIRASD